jgi:hypothetical protein
VSELVFVFVGFWTCTVDVCLDLYLRCLDLDVGWLNVYVGCQGRVLVA